LLHAIANWARWMNIDPEAALREANARFAQRVALLEDVARQRDLDLAQLEFGELEVLWQEAKRGSDA
jgi:uncharacterized protein YabN with tetrapyrrole methylase and pyrophosphatase domain